MNLPPSQPRLRHQSYAPPSPIFFPNDLIVEVLSLLSVKPFMRMRFLSKFCNSLFTDPMFVRLHFHRSSQEPHLALVTITNDDIFRVIPFLVSNLLEQNIPPITLTDDPCYVINNHFYPLELIHKVIGSCNGLICILSYSNKDLLSWLNFWNPTTRVMSKQVRFNLCLFKNKFNNPTSFKFSFGYDNSTNSYKVVVLKFHYDKIMTIHAKVFSLGDNVWRDLQPFPAVPFQMLQFRHQVNEGVYLSGTINWLAFFDIEVNYVEVIISLDLGTETYTEMRLPPDYNIMQHADPTICVLMNYLCFSHHFHQTHFIIWRMIEFGVEESWTQLFKIRYESLQIDRYYMGRRFYLIPLVALHLSENGDTLILADALEDQAILYNIRDNGVERTRITNRIRWFSVKNYVQSLVSA